MLEVLDGVGEKNRVAIDPGRAQGLVEYLACRPDERPARKVLPVTGLLAAIVLLHEHAETTLFGPMLESVRAGGPSGWVELVGALLVGVRFAAAFAWARSNTLACWG